ncbi:tyrosine-type recombinase/integrase [Dyadobacter diqingensis]|uniref:tyrosine-type recombinase/integrase n=1 Tax=Dyadobacter diqingensis TaxID=2938121 RepID=UPI0020C51E71|nr:site-specific integrase [Dyadobacter diqingensis]
MSASQAKYPYKEAVLADRKGDISKPWYVNYYVWSEIEGKLVRKRSKLSHPSKKERYDHAKKFIAVINKALANGLITDEIDDPTAELTAKTSIKDAMASFLRMKKATASENTYKGYKKDLKVFEEWAEKAGFISKPIKSIGTKEVFAFSDFLDAYTREEETNTKVGFSKKTFSNFISTLRTMWTVFTTREILKDNPFLKVVKRKGRSGQHIPYSPSQVRKFKKVCLDEIGDKQLWLFVNFIYYCFLRPAEEAQNLQIKHILKKTIVVPAEIAKNDLTEHIRIPKGLQKLIEEYKLRSFPGHFYIFTLFGEPGIKPVGNKYMYMHNKKVLDQAEFTDQDYDLYGWKHTGNIALYLATKDIKLVQAQNRHKDISTTDKYLRDLGLFMDEDALDLFPEAGSDHH